MRLPYSAIKERFSRIACDYESSAVIQKEMAQKLYHQMMIGPQDSVLDIGCGVGSLLRQMKDQHPQIQGLGVDFAQGMVSRAQVNHLDLDFICADACALPFLDNHFDLVFSSSSYQWVGDLRKAFQEVWRVLKPGASCYIVLFGRATFKEFFESLEASLLMRGKKTFQSVDRLPSEAVIKEIFTSLSFASFEIQVEFKQAVFKNAWELLKWTKTIGANNLSEKFFLGKSLISDLEQYYRERYGVPHGVRATYEMIWIQARK